MPPCKIQQNPTRRRQFLREIIKNAFFFQFVKMEVIPGNTVTDHVVKPYF